MAHGSNYNFQVYATKNSFIKLCANTAAPYNSIRYKELTAMNPRWMRVALCGGEYGVFILVYVCTGGTQYRKMLTKQTLAESVTHSRRTVGESTFQHSTRTPRSQSPWSFQKTPGDVCVQTQAPRYRGTGGPNVTEVEY